jgi:LDH2 family malate/lactate/ureidoglycolate dehydrogenase
MTPVALIDIDACTRFTAEVLAAAGLSAADAAAAADVLVYAEARGIRSHGITNLAEVYVPKLLNGSIVADARFRVLSARGATALWDAEGQLGLNVGREAMAAASAIARDHGVGCIAVRNSTHFGAAGFYAEMAADAGQVGFATTNLGPQPVAAPPGATPCLGTNPIAFAAGNRDDHFYSFDASTTVVATGRIKEAARRGQVVPDGWLFRPDRSSTNDPAEYMAGKAFPPMLGGTVESGGYKGFGLNLLVELLCGTLVDGPIAVDGLRGSTDVPGRVGHFFLAIDVAAFRPVAEFDRDVASAMKRYAARATEEDWGGLTYSGAPEAARLADARQRGIPVDPIQHKRMTALAQQLGVDWPAREIV